MECKLGEQGKDGMKRVPYSGSWPEKKIYKIAQCPSCFGDFDWAYDVQFGEWRSN